MTRLDRFRQHFAYEPDRGLEASHWRVLDEADPRGDCEDYALTVAWIVAGGSWRRFWWDQAVGRSQLWIGRTGSGAIHVALKARGRGWTDNTTGEWRDTPPMRRWFPVVPPLLAVLMGPWPVKLGLVGVALWASWPF